MSRRAGVPRSGPMVANTKVSGTRTRLKEMVHSNLHQVTFTQANGMKIRCMAKGNIHSLRGEPMRVSLKKAFSTVKVNSLFHPKATRQ